MVTKIEYGDRIFSVGKLAHICMFLVSAGKLNNQFLYTSTVHCSWTWCRHYTFVNTKRQWVKLKVWPGCRGPYLCWFPNQRGNQCSLSASGSLQSSQKQISWDGAPAQGGAPPESPSDWSQSEDVDRKTRRSSVREGSLIVIKQYKYLYIVLTWDKTQ